MFLNMVVPSGQGPSLSQFSMRLLSFSEAILKAFE